MSPEIGAISPKVSSNPFLACIEEYLSTNDLADRLAASPLTSVDVASLSDLERVDMLDRFQEEFFEPTSSSLDIGTRLLRLIRKGYINRDPTKSHVRKMTMELASYSGKELSALPWFSTYAKGMTVVGITGLGKTYEVKRILQLIPQCVEHRTLPEAHWAKMKQVTWLYVAMSHDGSLGGLLLQILVALDEVAGTKYSQDGGLIRSSNEKLAVRLGVIFRNHGLGVLVIDEIQSRNFQGHGRGEFAATFFLRLLNFGIPVVLMGNPLGLEALYSFSQDVRRIGSGGSIEAHPLEVDEFDWTDCLAPAFWELNLMPYPHQIENPNQRLFHYSGGIRDFAGRMVSAAQRLALDLGDQFLTEEHLSQAFTGSDFSDKERDIIAGFRERDPIRLIQFEDIPWELYATRWGLLFDGKSFIPKLSDENKKGQVINESNAGELAKPKIAKPVPQKDLETIKRRRTRKANTSKKSSTSKKTLDTGDMRVDGLQQLLVTGVESLFFDKKHKG